MGDTYVVFRKTSIYKFCWYFKWSLLSSSLHIFWLFVRTRFLCSVSKHNLSLRVWKRTIRSGLTCLTKGILRIREQFKLVSILKINGLLDQLYITFMKRGRKRVSGKPQVQNKDPPPPTTNTHTSTVKKQRRKKAYDCKLIYKTYTTNNLTKVRTVVRPFWKGSVLPLWV